MPTDWKSIGKKSSGGDPNVLTLKDHNRVRPLDNQVAGWRQHWIEHPSDPEQGSPVTCPGVRSCPLDRKPVDETGERRWGISKRFGVNVWDYDSNSVKVLIAGPQVFDEFKTVAEVGIDPCASDWTIVKSGQGRNTKYDVIRHDAEPFSAAQITPDMLHDVGKYEQPTSTEAIFELLERYGIDYDSLPVPSYTYEEALRFLMPYGKHKGLTIEQIVSQEESYAEYMHGIKLEQGALGDPVFIALQAVLEHRGLVSPLEEALQSIPDIEPTSPTAVGTSADDGPTPTPVQEEPSSAVGAPPETVELVSPDGQVTTTVPSAVVPAMLATGWTRPVPEPAPEPESENLKVSVGGQVVELPRASALMMIETGAATLVTDPAPEAVEEAPAEPEPPSLPLPDEVVEISIFGVETPLSLPYVQAAQMVDKPEAGASFVDERVAEAHARSKASAEENKAADPSSATTPAQPSTSASDDQPLPKEAGPPWKCSKCGEEYTRYGNYAKHMAKNHGIGEWPVGSGTPAPAATPAPTPAPAGTQSNGEGGIDQVRKRVEELLRTAPEVVGRDFDLLLRIFKEETGTDDFKGMNEEQLVKVEARVGREIEALSQ